jgi:hypothetical protein
MTFQQSRSLKLGASVSVKQTTPPGGVESSLTLNAEGTWTRVATQAYESGKTEEDTVSIPLKIPPKTRVTITSTIRKAEITVPFTYIVAWYDEKTKEILKEERLPGTYKGVQSWDIRHSTNEESLTV